MTIEIRGLGEDDLKSAMLTFAKAMHFTPLSGDAWELARERGYPDRSVGAFEHGAMVGNARSYPFRTFVPGGALVPTAGVSAVGTLPTHRRRGVLTRLMTTQLADCFDRGEPLASLRASEAPIYGRFGYGMAGHAVHVDIATRKGGLRPRIDDDGSFEYRRGPDLLTTIPDLQRRSLRRPGMLDRPLPIWKRALAPLLTPEQTESWWLVVHRDRRGRLDGYVEWETIDREHWGEKPATIEIGDVCGSTEGVEALLWQFLMDLDLVEFIKCESRPVDDPLRWRLADVRSYVVKETWDEQWLRLVDVAAALAARTYNGAGDVAVVLGVTDPVLPQNDGRFEISAAGARRVRRAADLDVPIDSLGAIYLGGTSVTELVIAGRIGERRAGAAARADMLLHSALAPWSGTYF